MDMKSYDRGDGAGVFSEDHSKLHVLLNRKGSPAVSSSSNSSRGHSSKKHLRHSSSSDESNGHDLQQRSGGHSISGKRRRNLRSRRSSGSSSGERKSPDQSASLDPSKASWDLTQGSLHTQTNVEDGLKYGKSGEQISVVSKEIRLSQLSSERDRSISVDRSSSSSGGRVVDPSKGLTGSSRPNNPKGKSPVENEKSDSSPKNSTSRSRIPKEISRRVNEKKRDASEDKSLSKSKRSRSRSRSPYKHRRRDYSPYRGGQRGGDRYRNRSPRRRSPYPRNRRSRSRSLGHSRGRYNRNRRSRSHGRHRRSRSRSFEKRQYRRDRSSSRDRYKKRHRSHSSSRSRSRGHSPRDRLKGKLGTNVSKLGSLPLSTTPGTMTPQMALQQTMAAMSAKAQALTGIELPKYYNPAAVNPLKYAEQVQKRKLLWQTKKETTLEQPKNSVWDKLTFQQDQDGKMTQKFRKLMGIKGEGDAPEAEVKEVVATTEVNTDAVAIQKQEELFRNLDQQYEMARMSTHTHRGVGLGYSSQTIYPPLQKP